MIFAAKEAVERRARRKGREKGRAEGIREGRRIERERVARILAAYGDAIPPELARKLKDYTAETRAK